jgi:predicted nicotinamide N-methyase
MLERLGSTDAGLVATDYYPSVLKNLERNRACNSVRFTSKFLDWSTFCDTEVIHDPIFEGGFDVVFGADIVYEDVHATWIKSCVAELLCKPSTRQPDPTFHLIIPLRASHTVESNTIEMVFRNCKDVKVEEETVLVVKHKEVIVCDAESGKDGEEVEYAYYRIGWS